MSLSSLRRRGPFIVFNCVWVFEGALLLFRPLRAWVPFASGHTFAFVATGFVVGFAMVLVIRSDHRAARRQALADE